MTVRFFMHTKSKRAKALALVDSGATENFMNLDYARYLCLPIQCLTSPCKLYNVDGTLDQSGDLLLRSITMPIKNFFLSSSLAPARSSLYLRPAYRPGTSLNYHAQNL